MKKICVLILFLSFLSMAASGCTSNKQKPNLIQAKRRFAEYMGTTDVKDKNVIDLSEGPRQSYDGYLGPQNLDFDIKIVDPY